MLDEGDFAVMEAERFLRSFTTNDLLYRDNVNIGGSLTSDEYVSVATWGAADELGEADEPEGWPIRLRVHNDDGNDAGVYLSIVEADQLCKALRAAIRRARKYPQPE